MCLIEEVGPDDPVCSEVSKVLAQLTPGSKKSYGIRVAEDHRPYHPFGLLSGFVTVADP